MYRNITTCYICSRFNLSGRNSRIMKHASSLFQHSTCPRVGRHSYLPKVNSSPILTGFRVLIMQCYRQLDWSVFVVLGSILLAIICPLLQRFLSFHCRVRGRSKEHLLVYSRIRLFIFLRIRSLRLHILFCEYQIEERQPSAYPLCRGTPTPKSSIPHQRRMVLSRHEVRICR